MYFVLVNSLYILNIYISRSYFDYLIQVMVFIQVIKIFYEIIFSANICTQKCLNHAGIAFTIYRAEHIGYIKYTFNLHKFKSS